MDPLKFCLFFMGIPLTHAAVPGTFFWKPRLSIDLSHTASLKVKVSQPTKENIEEGYVVLIEAYQFSMTMVALAAGIADDHYLHLNPTRGYFYTNAYRWALRHASLLPPWLTGRSGSYSNTHKVWKKRFSYVDDIMPKWLMTAIPYVKGSDWKNELKEQRRFKKFSEYAFSKHYRFPSDTFNDFTSFESAASINVKSSQSSSFDSSKSYNG